MPHNTPSSSSTSLTCPNSSSTLKRSPDVWFTEGTIIISAEKTAFRVIKDVLSTHSDFFKSMFDIPHSGEPSEMCEGLPRVHLPDSAADVKSFLQALHDFSYYDIDKFNNEDFDIIAGVLRMSSKYEVPALRTRSITWLCRRCPTTLNSWDTLKSNKKSIINTRRFELVDLARQCDVPILLPSSLLACTTNITQLLDGIETAASKGRPSRIIELSLSDQRLCLRAKSQFESLLRPFLYGFIYGLQVPMVFTGPSVNLTPIDFNCGRMQACGCVRGEFLKKFEMRLFDASQKGTKFGPFCKSIFPWDEFSRKICLWCYEKAWASYHERRQALWLMVPEVYGWKSWTECKEATK